MFSRRLTAVILALCVLHPFAASAATHEVSIVGLSFRPNDLTIAVGDTVRWTNNGGSHDVQADSGEWASAIGFDTYERTFDSVEAILYHCSVHSAPGRNISSNMNGRINVVAAQEPTFQVNAGPEDVTAILGEPGHRWLTAQGPYEGDTANLAVSLTSGGVFDAAQPPAVTDPAPVGTIAIAWAGCNEGILSYDLPSLGLAGEIPIERIVLDNVPACEAAQQPAQ
jgi:plastocyanin